MPDIDEEMLETEFIDKSSLEEVVSALADICRDKAYHVLGEWQDKSLAKSWERDARKLDALAAKLEN